MELALGVTATFCGEFIVSGLYERFLALFAQLGIIISHGVRFLVVI
jgi:hypothetical protein